MPVASEVIERDRSSSGPRIRNACLAKLDALLLEQRMHGLESATAWIIGLIEHVARVLI